MTEVEILREALEKIKKKSEMWRAAASSTAATTAVPPWWNLGDIAAAALKKAVEQSDAVDSPLQWRRVADFTDDDIDAISKM